MCCSRIFVRAVKFNNSCTMLLAIFLILAGEALALDNGLARTPPMGWLAWERFRCITDCDNFPNECISEKLIKDMADKLVLGGYAAAGYEYVGIDDCWLEKSRGPNGEMVPDRKRFPNGMKHVADYVHDKGLKFAMYQDYGNKTCAGYPGVLGHEEQDIASFVEWEIDYLKLDGCFIDIKDMEDGYKKFGKLLNESGRPIVYSCSWPAYQEGTDISPKYEEIAKTCNLWRNYGDIDDSFKSLSSIVDWFGDNQERLKQHAGPGHWNDPDMLIVGNFGLTVYQSKIQMAVWAVLAAPLLISNDLRTVRPEFQDILLNRRVIEVNQDELGIQGERILKENGLEVWSRPVQPIVNGYYSFAIAFVSQRTDGASRRGNYTYENLKLKKGITYSVHNLYHDLPYWFTDPSRSIEVNVYPTDVEFHKFVPVFNDVLGDNKH